MKIKMPGLKTRVAVGVILQLVAFIVIAGTIINRNIEKDEAKKSILLYLNEDVKEIEVLLSELKEEYESIINWETESDIQIHSNITDKILPKSYKIIEMAEDVEIENKEIEEVHNIYIDALKKQHEALEIYAEALGGGDEGKLENLLKANKVISDARIRLRDYQMSTMGLAEEHGLIF